MHFAEAENRYRELEEKLFRGELTEDDFLTQIEQLRVIDQEGRRWMLSARTGRWLVHDGQRWIVADPPTPESPQPEPVASTPPPVGTPCPEPSGLRSFALPRSVMAAIAALLLAGCLIGSGVAAWVFLLRDWGQPALVTPQPTRVSLVRTYTPRPVTATYTPTFTPTPSRTPTPTETPLSTDTPIATATVLPSNTPAATATFTPTPTWTPLVIATSATRVTVSPTTLAQITPTEAPPSGQTYTVKQGDTLFDIALAFGVSVEALARANGITDATLIRPGQVLVIPVPGTTPAPPTATPTASPTARTTATTTAQVTEAPTTRATATPTLAATLGTPTATATPRPTAVPTAQPVALSGKIAFTVWNPYSQKYELYVSRMDGTGRNMLGEGFRQPQFRPDGNLLAVNGDGAPNFEHLVTMDSSGGNRSTVSNFSEDSYPSWSPDGAIVAYSSASWGDGAVRLGIVRDMFGRQQDWIKADTTEIRGEYPYWMADGRVVYHGCAFLTGGGACSLYWVGAGGGSYHQLTNHESDTAPAGHGQQVAFMSSRDGNWEVYTVNMDGSGLKRLTNNGAQDGLPTWSPDGKSIAFVSNREGGWAIWAMNADGGNQRKLFDLDGGYGSGAYAWNYERISWAP
jgi:LysM repeat protein